MNINNFKEGDIITRNEPVKDNGDRSYMSDKMELVGVENGIIFVIDQDFRDEIRTLPTDRWSEGWINYPISLEKKAHIRLKELLKKVVKD